MKGPILTLATLACLVATPVHAQPAALVTGPAPEVPELAALSGYAGSWDSRYTVEGVEEERRGTAHGEWILGGRFLRQRWTAEASGGEYFTEIYKGKDAEPEIVKLGPSPLVTILYVTSTYSYFVKGKGTVAWTTDIHGFSALDRVTLFKKVDGKTTIDFDGSFPDFKEHKKKYVSRDELTGDSKNLLKFQKVLYVLMDGKPYKMFVSNASSAGIDADGLPSFDEPQEGSLQVFLDTCWANKQGSYEHRIMLGSRYVESSKPFYIMTFTDVATLPEEELAVAFRAKLKAEEAIQMIDESRRSFNQTLISADPTEIEPIIHEPSVSVEELPF